MTVEVEVAVGDKVAVLGEDEDAKVVVIKWSKGPKRPVNVWPRWPW